MKNIQLSTKHFKYVCLIKQLLLIFATEERASQGIAEGWGELPYSLVQH